MSGYPPPPDYNTATGGGYAAPGSKNAPFYNNTGSFISLLFYNTITILPSHKITIYKVIVVMDE